MKKSLLLVFTLTIISFSCNSAGDGPGVYRKKAGNEDEAILKYSSRMIANPRTQAEKDENIILSFLIDSLLDFERTASGIYYQIENPEEGASPNAGNTVEAHYRGTFLDGRVFDSSYAKGAPIKFKLNGVIKGWQEVIQMLKPGGKGTFIIPSGMAYGNRGYGRMIGPDTVLMFDIELISIQ